MDTEYKDVEESYANLLCITSGVRLRGVEESYARCAFKLMMEGHQFMAAVAREVAQARLISDRCTEDMQKQVERYMGEKKQYAQLKPTLRGNCTCFRSEGDDKNFQRGRLNLVRRFRSFPETQFVAGEEIKSTCCSEEEYISKYFVKLECEFFLRHYVRNGEGKTWGRVCHGKAGQSEIMPN